MSPRTVAILSPGDMGHAVGAHLREQGARVVTVLTGRSELTQRRAARAGFEDLARVGALVSASEVVLSIMPPAAAEGVAREVAEAMRAEGCAPIYADCNAVSPDTVLRMQAAIERAGAEFVDVGIIGGPPGRGRPATRFYASGRKAGELAPLFAAGGDGGVDLREIGDRPGRASGLKMVYAGLTKGTMTLHAAVLIAAERLGLSRELARELESSQKQAWARMQGVGFLPADSGRWIGEMEEIAATFESAGVTSRFHEGAAAIFRLMAASPFADETRETLDRSRSLEEAIRVFAALLD